MTHTGGSFKLFTNGNPGACKVRVGQTPDHQWTEVELQRFWHILHSLIRGGEPAPEILAGWLNDIARVRPSNVWIAAHEYADLRCVYDVGGEPASNMSHGEAIAALTIRSQTE